MRKKVGFALGGLIVVMVVVAVPLAVFGTSSAKLLPVGAQAPPFTRHTTTGTVVSLADFRGRAVVLEFCANWSSQCELEAPLLNQLASHTQAALLLINADSENAASVDAFQRQFHVRFPVLLDPGSKTVSFPAHGPRGPLAAQYRVTELPSFYVLDGSERVRWQLPGAASPAVLAREIRLAARSVP